ncbi:hypothetical protein [Parasitella parasitica]|uniref:Uncharacterized protein n=1 Tax=Parasitella parasitica TaxID=35722 RepID=A0A0B7MVU8_9FUNG|nr:hypothetical protein [Parasitella parasitica]
MNERDHEYVHDNHVHGGRGYGYDCGYDRCYGYDRGDRDWHNLTARCYGNVVIAVNHDSDRAFRLCDHGSECEPDHQQLKLQDFVH